MSDLVALVLERWAYVLTVVLLIIGLYGMLLKRNLLKKLIGMNIFQGAIILFYVAHAYKRGASVPVYDHHLGEHAEAYMNPIPHGLMLTAIVVSVATTGVALALLIVIYRTYGTLEETDLLEKLRKMVESNLPVLIVMPLLLGTVLVPALGLVRRGLAYPTTLVLLGLYVWFAVRGLLHVMDVGAVSYELAGWDPPVGIEFRLDLLSAFVVCVISIIAFLVSVYADVAVRREVPGREVPFYGLLFIMLLGLSGMVLTGDLFNLYVFFEVSSLSGYALMATGHRKAAVSAYRYLLAGTVGASFYLMGVGYLYVLTGSLNMVDVAARISTMGDNPALLISLVLMVVGLGLKMALFPMHLWLPDAYTYASSTATAIIAPVMTKVSAYVMLRMLFYVYDLQLVQDVLPVGTVITWFALAGVVVGSVMAIAQKDLKRMLAYSSVAQVAYIGVGIGLANPFALIGAMLHILNHAAMKCCLFMVTGGVAMQMGNTRMQSLDGIGRRMPWTFLGFTLAALAMIGLPPTNGFFSKWYLVLGGIQEGEWLVVTILVFSGLLTAVYFFRLLNRIYTNPPEGQVVLVGGELPLSMRVPVLLLGVGVLLLGLFNAWFVTQILAKALPEGLSLPAGSGLMGLTQRVLEGP